MNEDITETTKEMIIWLDWMASPEGVGLAKAETLQTEIKAKRTDLMAELMRRQASCPGCE